MTIDEAILRIKEHMEIHKLKELQAIKITESLHMAINALENQKPMKIKEIHIDEYYCPNCDSENNCD